MDDPFARQAILLTLLDEMKSSGSWCGETHLQKSAYFLQDGLGVPMMLEFTLYKHGPFSFELREVLGEMRSTFLIDIESRQPFGSSLAVADPGRRLKGRFPKTIARYASHIQFVAVKVAARDVIALERLGTALYVRRQNPQSTFDQQATTITDLKPHISLESALEAVSEVDELLADAPCTTACDHPSPHG